jgi:2-isopropylmalate synthase
VQKITDATGKELMPADIRAVFDREYVAATLPVGYSGHRAVHNANDGTVEQLTAHLTVDVRRVAAYRCRQRSGRCVRARAAARRRLRHPRAELSRARRGAGEDATAVAYVQLRVGLEQTVYGVGFDPNIVTATLRAVVSAINRGIGQGMLVCPDARSRQARVRVTSSAS